MTRRKADLIKEGAKDYQWRVSLVDTPEKRALYDKISAKSDLWLQRVEAPPRHPPRGAPTLGYFLKSHNSVLCWP